MSETKSIYINIPGVILAFIIESSLIFIFSFINIKYYKGKLSTIIIGGLGFICSVFLEGIIISIISKIFGQNSIMIIPFHLTFPGLFEETGRYICFKYILKGMNKDKLTSISYGIGHGGIESLLIGISFLRFIFIKETLIEQGILKEDLTFIYTLIGALERFITVFIHISLSVFVFKAFKENNIKFYILAIVIHDFVDFFAFLYQKNIVNNIFMIELFIIFFAIILSRYSYNLYINLEIKKDEKIEEETNVSLKDKKVQ